MIGGRQGEPEHRTAHLLDERSGRPRPSHPPRGLRPAPPVCLQHRRNRSPRREAVALHEDRAARRAYPEQHRRHRPELPAPGAQLGSSAAERRRLLPRSRQRQEALAGSAQHGHQEGQLHRQGEVPSFPPKPLRPRPRVRERIVRLPLWTEIRARSAGLWWRPIRGARPTVTNACPPFRLSRPALHPCQEGRPWPMHALARVHPPRHHPNRPKVTSPLRLAVRHFGLTLTHDERVWLDSARRWHGVAVGARPKAKN